MGFESSGFEIIYSNDSDKRAVETYRLNFGETDETDFFKVIRNGMERIPRRFDILLAGFPCQPFSLAGNRKGFSDKKRGGLFFAIIKVLNQRKPKAVFLENVKHLRHHDDEKTFRRMRDELRKAGYSTDPKILNSMDYGDVPQTRERVYIVGFRSPKAFAKFRWPDPIPLEKTVAGILERKADARYYYTGEDRFIYPKLESAVKRRDKVYQYRRVYVRENANGVAPTLTASMGMGGHNVPIIKDSKGIRKLTPRECARLQGFPESFIFPKNQADIHLYKQIGNSVTVPLVARIAENIRIALES